MTDLHDTFWDINSDGNQGTLSIFSVDAQGVFVGHLSLDVNRGRTDDIRGRWDDAEGKITFTLFLPNDPSTTLTQTYTGFLGSNDPDHLIFHQAILAGFFTKSDVVADVPRINFGWFAQNPRPQS